MVSLLRVSFLLLLAIVFFASAQGDTASSVLAKARVFFTAAQYDSTAQVLQRFIKVNGKHPANEYLVPLLIDALVRLRRDDVALRLAKIYRARFPTSAFAPRCRYLEAIIDARQHRYVDAVEGFSAALGAGLTPELDSLAIYNVDLLCRKALAGSELSTIARSDGINVRVKEIVEYYDLLNSYKTGEVIRARQSAGEFRKEYPRSAFVPSVGEIASKIKEGSRSAIQIALLVPLSGYDAEIGREVVQGVQLAADRFQASNRTEVRLIVRNTRSSLVETARHTLSLLNEHRVQFFIGPPLSADAVAAAAAIAGRDAVMITPTATDDGIAELGSNIFQLNAPLASLAVKLAEYAVKNLNIREFAILSPLNDYGQTLARRFKEQVIKLGGQIVDEQTFDEGATDFQLHLRRLRSRLIAVRRERLAAEQSLDYTPSRIQFVADSIRYADSTLEIGGLFIPAAAEEVVLLAPQVFFHKIRTQMLGCTGWHNQKTITDGKRYVEHAVISTNLETEVNDERWSDFCAQYRQRFQTDPDRVAALSFDAAEMLLKAIRETADGGTIDTKEVAQWLASARDYGGVSGRIAIDPITGANTEAAIVKISGKKFVRIE